MSTYTVLNITKDGKQNDISQLITNLSWGGDAREAARRLEFSYVYGGDYYTPKYKILTGSLVVLTNDQGAELFRGVVWEPEITVGEGSVTCFDHAIYLTHNMATYKFVNMAPDAMIKKICSDFGIQTGSIAATGITLSKLILREQLLWDMIVIILTEAGKRTGKKYRAVMKLGKLNIEEVGKQTQRWIIAEGSNLISASYRESLENMKNRVVIVGDKDQILADLRNDSLIKQYGMLQEYKRESNIKAAEAQVIAKNLLTELGKLSQEWDIEALGIDDVEAGQMIEVLEPTTGIVGQYYVLTDSHQISNGVHTMQLSLDLKAIIATKEAPNDNEQ